MNRYDNFLNQIPDEIRQKAEKHLFKEIAILKPQNFISGTTMHANDFHIIIPTDRLPDTFINGKLQSFQNRKIVTINPGDSILCTKGYMTKEYSSILIKPELIQRIAEEMGFSGEVRFLKLQNAFSEELLQLIKRSEIEMGRQDCLPLMIDCYSIQIVTTLLREFRSSLNKYPVTSPDCDGYIIRAKDYMDTFFSANITVGDICKEINVSQFHFIRRFKQKVGVSPHQYLLNVRIRKAEELLCLRQHSIAEVGMLCGFVNLSHFSSTFKEITHHSPSDYKKLYLN